MDILNNLTIGQVVAVIAAAFVFVKGAYEGIEWILDKLNLIHSKRTKMEQLKELIIKHEDTITEIKRTNEDLVKSISDNSEILKIQSRHALVRCCTDYISRGYIYQYELQSTLDMYHVYHDILNGNSYVTALIEKIQDLEIRY